MRGAGTDIELQVGRRNCGALVIRSCQRGKPGIPSAVLFYGIGLLMEDRSEAPGSFGIFGHRALKNSSSVTLLRLGWPDGTFQFFGQLGGIHRINQ